MCVCLCVFYIFFLHLQGVPGAPGSPGRDGPPGSRVRSHSSSPGFWSLFLFFTLFFLQYLISLGVEFCCVFQGLPGNIGPQGPQGPPGPAVSFPRRSMGMSTVSASKSCIMPYFLLPPTLHHLLPSPTQGAPGAPGAPGPGGSAGSQGDQGLPVSD